MNQPTIGIAATKVEKKAKTKKELNKQSSSESITHKSSNKDDTSSKCNGTTATVSSSSSGAITATQKRKDKKLKAQLAKQSSMEDSSSVESVARSIKTKAKESIPTGCNKTKRNSVDVEPPTKLTKDLQADSEAKKEERRKVKAPKYEYADPQYKTNKFDVLDLDDDDDYYISEEESVDSGVTTSTVDNAQQQNPKKVPAKVNVSSKNAKQSIPTPPPSSSAKSEKSKTTKEPAAPQSKKEKSPVVEVAEVQLSKKQKKKLAQQQARQQNNANAKSEVSNGDCSLSNSMHKLRLNDDTTIELVKENHVATGCNTVGFD